jgi:uncharacterized membrane protein SpoIIM required for sporulation
MKEARFVALRQSSWEAWDRLLAAAGRGRRRARADFPPAPDELPRRYRALCRDLALAVDRQYSGVLVDSLRDRVLTAHQAVYGARRSGGREALRFLLHGVPALVRSEWRFTLAAALLFFVPLLGMIAALQFFPDAVYLLLSPEYAGQAEEMYAPDSPRLGRPRDASTEWKMWGFYVFNNLRIDLQCFAGGVAFGLGSVFFLAYNGLVIGAVAGYLTQLGYIETFWGFVAGHSSFELIGAVLSGAAGLKLGMALVAPGRRSRARALREESREAVRLLFGAVTLTFVAAFVEAFWSPLRGVPVELKYGVGIALWCVLGGWLLLAGRGRAA